MKVITRTGEDWLSRGYLWWSVRRWSRPAGVPHVVESGLKIGPVTFWRYGRHHGICLFNRWRLVDTLIGPFKR